MKQEHPPAPLASRIAAMLPDARISYHVAFDTTQARRGRSDPEKIGVNGYLLLDDGRYIMVTAVIPLTTFWQMKAMDTLAVTRTLGRLRAERAKQPKQPDGAQPKRRAQIGSVWLVDGELETQDVAARADAPKGPGRQKVYILHVAALHALERVAIEPSGPRLIESFDFRDMLPALEPDGR